MPNLAALTPFRQLAAVAPFTRNVDALFKDFFISPWSLDATPTRQPTPEADTPDTPAGQQAAAAAAAPATDHPA